MQKSNQRYILVPVCTVLLVFGVFLTVRFKDYLEANDQGICWVEGRKLPIEEMRVRALKTHVLQHKAEFDDETRGLGQRYSYWRIIKQDYDGETIFKLGLTFPLSASGHENSYPKVFDSILKVEDFDYRLYQDSLYDDGFYKDIIENNYMLMASYESYLGGLIFKIGSYKLRERSQLAHVAIPELGVMGRVSGFGFYYFSIQSIGVDFWNYEKNKDVFVREDLYAVSNCGDFVNIVGGSYGKINGTAENPFLTVASDYEYVGQHYSMFAAFVGFLKGI